MSDRLTPQLHEQSKTVDVFHSKLGEIGADFPEWFVKNLDRVIVTMHPKYKRKAAKAKAKTAGNSSTQKDLQSRKFPGLSMPDSEWKPAESYLEELRTEKVEPMPNFESKSSRPSASDYIDGPTAKRPRNRSPPRDNLPPPRYAQRPAYAGPDDRPILYKIYDGTITNVRDFGAFVLLEGVRGRTEGEFHTWSS